MPNHRRATERRFQLPESISCKNSNARSVFGIVYLITNRLTGKQYVGQTIGELQTRFAAHCRVDSLLGRAIAKHGAHAFDREIIFEAFDEDALNEAEIDLIAEYDALSPRGYNLALGGCGVRLSEDELAERAEDNELRRMKLVGDKLEAELVAMGYRPGVDSAEEMLTYMVARYHGIPRASIQSLRPISAQGNP